jgi:hypothetical protein
MLRCVAFRCGAQIFSCRAYDAERVGGPGLEFHMADGLAAALAMLVLAVSPGPRMVRVPAGARAALPGGIGESPAERVARKVRKLRARLGEHRAVLGGPLPDKPLRMR